MKKGFLLPSLLILSLLVYQNTNGQSPQLLWGKSFGNLSAEGTTASTVIVDSNHANNLYVTGTITNGQGRVGEYILDNGYLALYDSSGYNKWAVETVNGYLAVDNIGNVYVAASFKGTRKIGNNILVTADSTDMLLMKYDTNGNLLWYRQSSGAAAESPSGIGISTEGVVYITGNFESTATIGGTALSATHTKDAFLTAYNSSGTPLWATQMGGTNVANSQGPQLAISNNNVFVTALFTGTAFFGSNTLNCIDSVNIFLAKYDNSGNCAWVQHVKNGQQSHPILTADKYGNAYLAGEFTLPIQLGAVTLNNSSFANLSGLFLARYNRDGSVGWANKPGDGHYYTNQTQHLQINPAGILYFTGRVPIDINTSFYPLVFTRSGNFFARYDSTTGNCLSVDTVSSIKDPGKIAFGADNKLYLAGTILGSLFIDSVNFLAGGIGHDFSYPPVTGFIASLDSSYNYNWGKTIGALYIAPDAVGSITTDAAHNVISAGYLTYGIVSGTDTLNALQASQAGFVIKTNAAGQLLWKKVLGKRGSSSVYDILTDTGNNIYIAGTFTGIDSIGLTTVGSAGSTDIFIAKYDAAGNQLWIKTMGGTGADVPGKLAKDANSNIILTGYFNGNALIGNQGFASAGRSDIFVLKMDSDGNYLWQKSFGGINYDEGHAVSVDNDGNIFITGFFSTDVFFGSTQLSNSGNYDIFLTKLDIAGNVLWAKKFGGTGYNFGNGLLHDGNGGVYLSGTYRGMANMGCSTFSGSTSSPRGYLARYSSIGDCLWVDSIANDDVDVTGISLSPSGNVFISGTFYQSLDISNNHFTGSGAGDMFMAAFNPSGNNIWAKQINGSAGLIAPVINAGIQGVLFVGGTFGSQSVLQLASADISLEPGNAAGNLVSTNFYDAFLASFTDGIVPLKLLSFTAVKKQQAVQLQWNTANEINFSRFEIEQSNDGISFGVFNVVNGKGNQANNSYTTQDNQPFIGYNYYRLKMIDTDGKFTYSPVAKIYFDKRNSIMLSPNPVKDIVTITGIQNILSASVMDMNGRLLISFSNIQNNNINVQGLARGCYLLQLKGKDNMIAVLKFVKR